MSMALLVYSLQLALVLLVACAILVPVVVTGNLIRRLCSDQSLPATLPWSGVDATNGGGPLARARANLASVLGMKALMDEGYSKYSKNGKPYVLPHILTGAEVVLPPSQARWLVEQPDTVLNQNEVNRRFLEADHTFLHPNIVREPVHPGIIRRELTHRLASFTEDIVAELDACLWENWGTDPDAWREVKVYDTMLDVISRLSTRAFVGEELCRNKEFLHAARTFNKNVVVAAALLNLLPGFLKPIFASIITTYDYLQYRTCAKFALPIIKDRLRQSESEEKLPLFSPHEKAATQNDYFTWAISHAKAHWDPTELLPAVIARRLACLCFAAIQSSVISITNALFDLASSPHCAEWLDAMRQEVQDEISAFAYSPPSSSSCGRDNTPSSSSSSSSVWSKAALARLHRVDSALRESMRLNGFVARGIMKRVVAPGGVTLPDGSHVPRGTNVGIQAYSVHRDEALYADAGVFKAFRFAGDGGDGEDGVGNGGRARQPKALVSTSPSFLAFSHGPNACPGRFFAANQLKLTLAHIALHYEIEPIRERPVNKWFVSSMAAPMWETLRVRRRRA